MEIYVSDLDGTLLNSNKEISQYTKVELNKLIGSGVNFTIATARTPATVVDIMSEVNIKIPAVLMNGVVIYDLKKEKYIDIKDINNTIVDKCLDILERNNKDAFIYAIKDDHLWVFHKELKTIPEQNFFSERCKKKQKTFIQTKDYRESIKDHKIINFVLYDKYEVIKDIYDELKEIDGLTTNYYEEIYEPGWYFLESYSLDASKANGIRFLSNYINHNKIITFGDNINDIPMFEISDECYALNNATPELKKIATKVIGNNNDDAVVKFLKERFFNN